MPINTDAQADNTQLGKSLHFKGEMGGSGDVVLDGHVEGSVNLPKQCVTVGPNGEVQADIRAREVIVHGKLKGNVSAQDRIEIARTGSVWGDLEMARISIQDGAFFQGRVNIRTETAAPDPPRASPVAGYAVAASAPLPATVTGGAAQGSLLETKS